VPRSGKGNWDLTPGEPNNGLSCESLYKALSEDGNPSFATVLKVARALGVRLHAQVAQAPH
jgi:probable addiction module antidote protein